MLAASVLAFAAYYVSVRLSIPAAAPGRWAIALLAIAPIGVLLLSAGVRGSLHFDLRETLAHGPDCLMITLLLALPPGLLMLIRLRRSANLSPWTAGALLGAASGILAALCSHVLCQNSECGHVLLVHGGAILLMAMAGSLLWSLLAARVWRRRDRERKTKWLL